MFAVLAQFACLFDLIREWKLLMRSSCDGKSFDANVCKALILVHLAGIQE